MPPKRGGLLQCRCGFDWTTGNEQTLQGYALQQRTRPGTVAPLGSSVQGSRQELAMEPATKCQLGGPASGKSEMQNEIHVAGLEFQINFFPLKMLVWYILLSLLSAHAQRPNQHERSSAIAPRGAHGVAT